MVTTVDFTNINSVSDAPKVTKAQRLAPPPQHIDVSPAKPMFAAAVMLTPLSQELQKLEEKNNAGKQAQGADEKPHATLQPNRHILKNLQEMQKSFGEKKRETASKMQNLKGVIVGFNSRCRQIGFAAIPDSVAMNFHVRSSSASE